MTTLREAAQQALEALVDAQNHNYALKHKEADQLINALRAALAEQKCHCGDRPADQCPGEWEPGCDLGANEKHAKVAEQAQPLTIERLRAALVASRVIDSDAVEDPDNYDDGVMLHRIEALFRRIA